MTTQSTKPRQASVRAEQEPAGSEPYGPIVLKLAPALELTDEQLLEICSLNDDIRIERNSQGELELMPPVNITGDKQNLRIATRLEIWAIGDGKGEAFGPTAGFILPNGSMRSPDASWILNSRLADLTDENKVDFGPICPDFVIELRSKSDRLRVAQDKMEEYIANGARLGWLIDPVDLRHRVYVYRPGTEVEVMEAPESVSGDPELPGFLLDLNRIWQPGL